MKQPIWISAASIIIVIALIGSIYFLSPPDDAELQLEVTNLTASTDGQVSFNVFLSQGNSGVLNSVVLNNTHYSWSDGSSNEPTILKGETKHWSVNIGNLVNGSNIQVTVQAPPATGNSNVIVQTPPVDTTSLDEPNYVYDSYGAVGLFAEGIHVIATSKNPCTMSENFTTVKDYWNMLKAHETTTSTDQDFITILLSRGDKPTGGYAINIESFGWLESYPVKFRFHINVTDPGEDIMVSQALTNPSVLVPIGKLTPGEYHIELNVTWFILNVDSEGNTVSTPVMTFAPIVWKQTLTIASTQDNTSSTTFKVVLNGNEAPDLTFQLDLSDGLTETEAKQITEHSFIQALGEEVLRRLDKLTFDNQQITAHYTWGYDENDMGHILDLTADLTALQIIVDHCR